MRRNKPMINEPEMETAYLAWPNTGLVATRNRTKGVNVVDLFLDDVIGSQFGGVSPKQFNEQISAAGEVDRINLFINSPGGSVFDGIAMYNTLRNAKAEVVVEGTGLAAAAASVVMLAGDVRRMAESSFLMIHDPWDMTMGSAEVHRIKSDRLSMYADKIANIYEKHTDLTADQAQEMMSRDQGDGTWFDSEEAMDLGFVGEVTEPIKMAAHVQNFVGYFGAARNSVSTRTKKMDKRLDFMKRHSLQSK